MTWRLALCIWFATLSPAAAASKATTRELFVLASSRHPATVQIELVGDSVSFRPNCTSMGVSGVRWEDGVAHFPDEDYEKLHGVLIIHEGPCRKNFDQAAAREFSRLVPGNKDWRKVKIRRVDDRLVLTRGRHRLVFTRISTAEP